MYILTAPGACGSRFYTRLRRYIVSDGAERAEYERGTSPFVYLRLSLRWRRESFFYVGQSVRPLVRDTEHLVDGSLQLGTTDHVRRADVQWCDMVAGRQGSVGAWIDVPLCAFLRPPVLPRILLRAERMFINLLGKLNVRHRAWGQRAQLLGHHSGRSRPVMSRRGRAR